MVLMLTVALLLTLPQKKKMMAALLQDAGWC